MASARSCAATQTTQPLAIDTSRRASLDVSSTISSANSTSSQSRCHTPSSSVPNTPLLQARLSSPERRPLHPTEPNTFFTALAAQERKVLELKEELQKAESDLDRLKKQWAAQEASRKRDELRHVQQLQPLKVSSQPTAMSKEVPSRDSKHGARERAGSSGAKTSQRKVFLGSRHTRTLSLLAPQSLTGLSGSPLPTITDGDAVSQMERPTRMSKPASERRKPTSLYKMPSDLYNTDKDAILETGLQIVGDFRQGLRTFFEDLKQVTVGEDVLGGKERSSPQVPSKARELQDEATVSNDAKKFGTREARPHAKYQQVTRDSSIGVSQNISNQAARPELNAELQSKADMTTVDSPSSSESGDEWDEWETPERKSGFLCREDHEAAPSFTTESGTPRTSTSSTGAKPPARNSQNVDEQQETSILRNLSPSKFTLSASMLMDEWERSLRSPDTDTQKQRSNIEKS